jgi:hypothetical protein
MPEREWHQRAQSSYYEDNRQQTAWLPFSRVAQVGHDIFFKSTRKSQRLRPRDAGDATEITGRRRVYKQALRRSQVGNPGGEVRGDVLQQTTQPAHRRDERDDQPEAQQHKFRRSMTAPARTMLSVHLSTSPTGAENGFLNDFDHDFMGQAIRSACAFPAIVGDARREAESANRLQR